MNFDQVFEYTDKVPGAFMWLSAKHMWDVAQGKMRLVEVGVDQGRSASILLHAAREVGGSVTLIDSWPHPVYEENWRKVTAMCKYDFGSVDTTILKMPSEEAILKVKDGFDFIHIDANHTEPGGIDLDCALWLPKLASEGIACFHDYGESNSFPAVKKWVDLSCKGWGNLGEWEGLAIRRKP